MPSPGEQELIEPTRAQPILKWAGGKTWAVRAFGDDIFNTLKARGGDYIEPFLGGAAMALHLGWPRMYLNDIEQDLIDVYEALQTAPEALNELLREMEPVVADDDYYAIRDSFPDDASLVERAARCIYLNKRCYNGLWRKNKQGNFNVGPGTWLNGPPPLPDYDRLKFAQAALQGATLTIGDFERVIRVAGPKDVVYADPPYIGTSKIGRPGKKGNNPSFDKYSADGFSMEDQERLAACLRAAARRGAAIFAHNANAPEIMQWYGDWAEVISINERRAVNCKGDDRKGAPCVFIAYCPTLGEAPGQVEP